MRVDADADEPLAPAGHQRQKCKGQAGGFAPQGVSILIDLITVVLIISNGNFNYKMARIKQITEKPAA